MQLHIQLRSPGHTQLRCKPAPTLAQPSRTRQLVARCVAFAQAWRERRRVERTYRQDLRTLAGLSERDLADFGAPCWLRADVERYR